MSVEITDKNWNVREDKPDRSKLHSTPDLGLVAAMCAIGHKILDVDSKQTGPVWKLVFFFDAEAVKPDIMRWYNRELRVEPRAMLHNFNDLLAIARHKRCLLPAEVRKLNYGPPHKTATVDGDKATVSD